MNNNKITFRVPVEQYDEIKKMAEDSGVSVGEMARKLMSESAAMGRIQSVMPQKEELSYETLRSVNKVLALMEYEIEKLPDYQKQKNVLKKGVEDIWHTLN